MENRNEAGLLLTPDIKLHRQWFREMAKLQGVGVIYYRPLNKYYTTYTEIKGERYHPDNIYVIYEQTPTQRTMKALGWNSELSEGASIIHVEYGLTGLQVGSLFLLPSGIDGAQGRLFRVSKMSNIALYPASIACEIVPEYSSDFNDELFNHEHNSLNLLDIKEED